MRLCGSLDHLVRIKTLSRRNLLVEKQLRLRLVDFAGSSIGKEPVLVVAAHISSCPRVADDASRLVKGLFTSGSTINEIMTNRGPYEEFGEEEVESRYADGDFPAVSFQRSMASLVHVLLSIVGPRSVTQPKLYRNCLKQN